MGKSPALELPQEEAAEVPGLELTEGQVGILAGLAGGKTPDQFRRAMILSPEVKKMGLGTATKDGSLLAYLMDNGFLAEVKGKLVAAE